MKKKRKDGEASAKDAAFEARPDMLALDAALKELVRVPKEELDAKIEAEKKRRQA